MSEQNQEQRSPERQGNPNANRVCEFISCPFGLPAGHRIKDHPMPPPEAGRCSTVKGDTRCRREPHASGPHEFDHTRVEGEAVAETPLTVEAALGKLRELFPDDDCSIEAGEWNDPFHGSGYHRSYRIKLNDGDVTNAETLTEAVQKVREYAERINHDHQ